MYLVAAIDWFRRFVLAWQFNTLDGLFCLDALRLALQQGRPDIFNTDQGGNSLPSLSLTSWKQPTFVSAWTVAAVPSTISSLSGSGVVSNMRTSISRTIGPSQLWKSAYLTTSTFTTMSVLTRAWPIAHRLLFISRYLLLFDPPCSARFLVLTTGVTLP